MDQVRKHFKPEFVNRIDEFIIFEPLKRHEIAKIVRLRLKGVINRLGDRKMKLVSPYSISQCYYSSLTLACLSGSARQCSRSFGSKRVRPCLWRPACQEGDPEGARDCPRSLNPQGIL